MARHASGSGGCQGGCDSTPSGAETPGGLGLAGTALGSGTAAGVFASAIQTGCPVLAQSLAAAPA
jgi:hypothetical protein